MEKSINFDSIDFDQIEYRNEYKLGRKALFCAGLALLAAVYYSFMAFGHSVWNLAFYSLMVLGELYTGVTHLVSMKSRFVITGSSLILKRPIFKDVELPFSEIGSIEFSNNGVGSKKVTLTERPFWSPGPTKCYWDQIKLKPIDGKRKITIVGRQLVDYDQFVSDLALRMVLAEERYLGYKKGSIARQPERTKQLHEKLIQTIPPRWFKRFSPRAIQQQDSESKL